MRAQIIEFPENAAKNQSRRNFKNGFPGKAAVEVRINTAIDSASSLAQLKTAMKKILNGDGQTPGIVDALFYLNR